MVSSRSTKLIDDKPVTIKFIQQEKEHVKNTGHQDTTDFELEQEAATLEEVSNNESETIEPEPTDQENEHVKNVGHQDRNELEPEQDVAALDHDSSSDNKSVTIRTSEQKEETTRKTGHQHPNHSPEAAISDLRKTKAVLLQYEKEIRNGFCRNSASRRPIHR